LLSLVVASLPVQGQQTESKPIKRRQPTKFIRVEHDEFKAPVALQTATVKYVLKDDAGKALVEVTLESVVHVADAAYYRGFDRRFEHYDAVLYELIAPPELTVPTQEGSDKKQAPPHPMKILQELMGDSLGFVHQTDAINYKAENMVHADLSPAEMKAARLQRGDDDLMMLADAVVEMLRKASSDPSDTESDDDIDDVVDLLDLDFLSDPDSGIKLRRMLAKTFDTSHAPHALLRPTQVRSLIDDRNERAMEVLQEQIDQGRTRIAFFWGAAHMPDLEKRMILGYGFERESVRWRNAWDLREGAVSRAPLDSILEKRVRSTLDDVLDSLFEKRKRD
jgi:hypothetical protein